MLRRCVLSVVIACLLAAGSAVGQRLINTIQLPDSFGLPRYFCALVANTRDSVLYAGGEGTDSILVFDEVLNRPVARFGIPGPVTALHYNPPLNRLYCAGTDGHIYVIDCATHTLIADVPGAERLYAITWDSLDNKLYIAADTSTLLAFDCSLNAVVGRIRGVRTSWYTEMCFVSSTRQVYVTGAGDSLVAVVDCAGDSVTAWLRVGSSPAGFTYCSGVDRVCFVSGPYADSLTIVDPVSGGIVSVLAFPWEIRTAGFNPTSRHLYLINYEDFGLSVVDLNYDSLTGQIMFGDSVKSIGVGVYSARDNLLYVSTNGIWGSGDEMAGVIDGATDSVQALIPSPAYAYFIVPGALPGVFYFMTWAEFLPGFDATRHSQRTSVCREPIIVGLAASGPTGKVYCTVLDHEDLSWSIMYVVDTVGWRVVADGIDGGLGDSPEAIVVKEDGSKVYLIGWSDNEVLVVDGMADTLLCRVVTGHSASTLAFGARHDKLYAAGHYSDVVSVIDGVGDSVLAEIPVNGRVEALCVVGYGAELCVAGRGDTISVIDGVGDSVIAELEVGAGLHRLCWDSRSNRLYVANVDSNDVMVFDCETDGFLGLLGTDAPVISMCFDSTHNRLFCASSDARSPGTLVAFDCATGTRTTVADDVGAVDDYPPYYDAVSNLLFYGSTTGIGVFDCELDSVVSRVECFNRLLPFASAPGWNRVMVAEDWGSRLYVLSSEPRSQASIRPSVPPPVHQQTLVSGSIFVQGAQRAELFSVSGALVARLVPGYNDVSGITPGVYFLSRGSGYITRKIVVSR
jgi:YVTN family beta-propeller protein